MNKAAMLAAALAMAAGAYGSATDKAVDLVKGFEGFRPSVYRCEAGKATIGYGFTSAALVGKGHMTEAEASSELERLCGGISDKLHAELGVGNPLAPHEEAAVVSFIYNVGWGNFKKSTMCKLLKEGKRGAIVGVEFHKWTYVTKGGKKTTSKGLQSRRLKEAVCFMCG